MIKSNFTSNNKICLCEKCNQIAFPVYICKNNHYFCEKCTRLWNLSCSFCFESIAKSDDSSLDQLEVTCKGCGHVTVRSEMENHFNQCSKVTRECDNCGNVVFAKNYKEHLEKNCQIRWDIKCPFGCNTTGFSELQLKEHREEKIGHHTDIVLSIQKLFGLQNILGNAGGDNILNVGFYDGLRKDDTNDFIELQNLREEVMNLKKKIHIKRYEKKEQMRLLERSISETLLTSYNSKVVWIIDDSEDRASDVRSSPIFYTGKYGYKLQLILRKTDNNQVLFLKYLPWAYDPILPKLFETNSTLVYKFSDEDSEEKKVLKKSFDRTKKETEIEVFRLGTLAWIKFEIDCSEFSLSSND